MYFNKMSQGTETWELKEKGRQKTDDELNEEREKAVELFQERVGKGGKPLNIAVIGAAGCGKSSFCNSIMTSFCVEDRWRERATVGHHGGLGEQITHHLMSFSKIEYLDSDALYDYNYPTLVDMNGFNDSCDEMVEELLRIVFFGRLPHEEKLMDAVKLYREDGQKGLRQHYCKDYEDMKIDRIIFIASATSSLPNRLMEAVRKTARKENRVIPLFGVLTHKDKISKVDQEYQTLEKDFRESLGLPDNRFLLCTTYCDDYDRLHKSRLTQRHPEIDIPVLDFMREVCDPVYKVIKDHTTYDEIKGKTSPDTTTPTDIIDQKSESPAPTWWATGQNKTWIRLALISVLVFFLLQFLGNGMGVSRVCSEHCPRGNNDTRCTSGSLHALCEEQSILSNLKNIFVTFLFVAIFVAMDLMMDRL